MALSPYSHAILLHLLLLLIHPSIQNSLNPVDLQALFDIRSNLRGLRGSNDFSTWDFTTSRGPCTSFSGISCSPDPTNSSQLRVSVLTLGTGLFSSPGLIGSLPNSISNLTSLTELVIYPGKIAGPIPTEIGLKCRNLRLISISNNLISGKIPDSFSLLTELHTLDLSHNNLTGPIPVSLFSSLPNLKILVLASNNLSGFIPSSLSFSPLLHLDLCQNAFSGFLPPLPPTVCYVSVSANSLYGLINSALSSELSELAYIDLSMNKFTGKIPTTIFALPQLKTIRLQRNNFSGPLIMPEWVPPWQVVDLSHNMIGGEVPRQLATAESLFLNSNRLIGVIPKEFGEKIYDGRMITFYAQHNFLNGFALPEVGPLPGAVTVCLSYNCMDLLDVMVSGCPASAGMRQSRPREQCPSYGSRLRLVKG